MRCTRARSGPTGPRAPPSASRASLPAGARPPLGPHSRPPPNADRGSGRGLLLRLRRGRGGEGRDELGVGGEGEEVTRVLLEVLAAVVGHAVEQLDPYDGRVEHVRV